MHVLAEIQIMLQSVRKHWIECDPRSVHLKELDPLLHDYQQLVAAAQEYVKLQTNINSFGLLNNHIFWCRLSENSCYYNINLNCNQKMLEAVRFQK